VNKRRRHKAKARRAWARSWREKILDSGVWRELMFQQEAWIVAELKRRNDEMVQALGVPAPLLKL
jgi:hypothetical protein